MSEKHDALRAAGFALKGAKRWVHDDGRIVVETEGAFREKVVGKSVRWKDYVFPKKTKKTEEPKEPKAETKEPKAETKEPTKAKEPKEPKPKDPKTADK